VAPSSSTPPCSGFRGIRPDDLEWITRPHEPGEPARHVAELSDLAGFAHTRANIWRYEPGAKGRRHRHKTQEETFVVLSGTLSMYVGDPPERRLPKPPLAARKLERLHLHTWKRRRPVAEDGCAATGVGRADEDARRVRTRLRDDHVACAGGSPRRHRALTRLAA